MPPTDADGERENAHCPRLELAVQGTGRGPVQDEQSDRCQHGSGQQPEHVGVGDDVDQDHGAEDDAEDRTGHQLAHQRAVELAAAPEPGETAGAGDDVVQQVWSA